MIVQRINGTLWIKDVSELSFLNAPSFRTEVCAAISPGLKTVEIDLVRTRFVDSHGLGALVSLYKTANEQNPGDPVTVRLVNLQPAVQQMLELTRMHHLFELMPGNGEMPGDCSPPGSLDPSVGTT